MKVLFVNSLYGCGIGGGAEVILRSHVLAMRDHGHEVAVLTLSPEKGLVRDRVDGVNVWRAGLRNLYWHHGAETPPAWKRFLWHLVDVYNPLMIPPLRNVVKNEKPDLVAIHNLPGWSVTVWTELRRLGLPSVQLLHDQYVLCPRSTMFDGCSPCMRQCLTCKALRLFHPALSGQVTAVVGVSRFILQKVHNYGYFRGVPISEVIHNAIHPNADMQISQVPNRDSDRIVYGFIGSLLASKGIEMLLDVFAELSPDNWSLIVAGTGKKNYELSLKERYSHERISFIGRVAPEQFFRQVDVTIVPSLGEDAFPGVVFESFFFGVPVIGSRRGGIPEMVREGVNGVLFNPEEPCGLISSMNDIAVEIMKWRDARSIIRETSKDFADVDRWTERWITLYRKVIHEHRRV